MSKKKEEARSLYERMQALSIAPNGGASQIQINENRDILIESCAGILRYDENEVKVLSGKWLLTLTGIDLSMQGYGTNGLMVRGELHSITFEARGNAHEA